MTDHPDDEPDQPLEPGRPLDAAGQHDLDAVERRLLAHLADGCSASEAAAAEGLTIHELAVRLVAVRGRLGVRSTREAIAQVVPAGSGRGRRA